eukprot:128096-Karenia_brevis.AAC.1
MIVGLTASKNCICKNCKTCYPPCVAEFPIACSGDVQRWMTEHGCTRCPMGQSDEGQYTLKETDWAEE